MKKINYFALPGLKEHRVPYGTTMDIQVIINAVCRYFDATRTEVMLTKDRKGPTIRRKKMLSYLLYEDARLSYPQVGKVMELDHSTIVYHVRTVRDYIFSDTSMIPDLSAIRALYYQ